MLLWAGTLILYCAALYCTVICTSIFKVEKREDKEVCYHEEILMNSYTALCIFVLYLFCTTIYKVEKREDKDVCYYEYNPYEYKELLYCSVQLCTVPSTVLLLTRLRRERTKRCATTSTTRRRRTLTPGPSRLIMTSSKLPPYNQSAPTGALMFRIPPFQKINTDRPTDRPT